MRNRHLNAISGLVSAILLRAYSHGKTRRGQKVQHGQNFSDHAELHAYAAHIQINRYLEFKVFNK